MSELITIGGELTLQPDAQEQTFHRDLLPFIMRLGAGGRAIHCMVSPCQFGDPDQPETHETVGAVSLNRFLDSMRSLRDRGAYPQRLRPIPEEGGYLGNGHYATKSDQQLLVEMTNPMLEVGEEPRFIPWSMLAMGLQRLKNPYADHALRGAAHGIPSGSVWVVIPASELDPSPISAMRVMSYTKNLGHDFLQAAVVTDPARLPRLMDYARFLIDAYDHRAMDADEMRRRIWHPTTYL
jgi:hypothetical protein